MPSAKPSASLILKVVLGKRYITTPIYYVNDVPHIGHAYTTVAADCLARYWRMLGHDVFLLTGTDEHGAKVAEAASARGKSPQAYADEISAEFQSSWRQLAITNDYFVRTTDNRHELAVQAFLQDLYARGQIYKARYEGLYCVGCERFVTEDELVNGECPDHRQKPIAHAEDNYFFRLSEYENKLLELIQDESHPQHISVAPPARRNEVLGKLRVGLSDISISRAALAWGVPLPFDSTQTTYVWVDALLSYISALGYADDRATFVRFWPADVHLMAKDILWFHAIIWPAMLLAADMPLPKRVFAHGFFSVDGQKMSKTVGNVLRPQDMVDRFGVDASRYLLLSEFPFGSDGDMSLASFTARYNSSLANDLGNLVNRACSMINRYFGGQLPASPDLSSEEPADRGLAAIGAASGDQLASAMESQAFHEALAAIWSLVGGANRYVEQTAPWTLAKTDRSRLTIVLGNLAEAIRLLAQSLWPFMPSTADKIAAIMGSEIVHGANASAALRWTERSRAVTVSARPDILFPKIEN